MPFILGILLHQWSLFEFLNYKYLFLPFFVICTAGFINQRFKTTLFGISFTVLICLFSILHCSGIYQIELQSFDKKEIHLIGYCIEEPKLSGTQYKIALQLKSIVIKNEEHRIKSKVYILSKKNLLHLKYGDLLSCKGIIRNIEDPKNAFDFNFKSY
ncbi:MAG: DUF4131 domain-containing protein, partial [Bacteroidota bacterium]